MANKFATLEELNNYYKSTKPTNDGSMAGAKAEKDYWGNYKKDLQGLYDTGAVGDYSSYQILRDYVSGQSDSSESYYKNLQLLADNAENAKVEQSILKDQSLKRANTSLEAAGLGGSGVGQSIQTGIGNQYATNINEIEGQKETLGQEAYTEYQRLAQEATIAKDDAVMAQEQEKTNSAYALASEMLNSGVDIETVLANYGEGLTDQQKNSLRDIASASDGSAFAIKAIGNNSKGISMDTINQIYMELSKANVNDWESIIEKYNDVLKITEDYSKVRNELDYIMTNSEFAQNITEGMVVQLVNGSNDSIKAYLVYHNGVWFPTTAEYFTKASNKQTVKGK